MILIFWCETTLSKKHQEGCKENFRVNENLDTLAEKVAIRQKLITALVEIFFGLGNLYLEIDVPHADYF